MATAENDSDEGIRVAAIEALRTRAGLPEMPRLLTRLLGASSQPERDAAEGVLAALCSRLQKTPGGDIVIQKAIYGALPDGPSADVTAKVEGLVASGALSFAVNNANFGEPAPGIVKKLSVSYAMNGAPASQTVVENGTMTLKTAFTPPEVVDAFIAALEKAEGSVKPAMLRLLSATGSPKAFEIVRRAAFEGEGEFKELALRELCEWPDAEALPVIMDLAGNDAVPAVKTLAIRGAVRLLGTSPLTNQERLLQYAGLLEKSSTPEEKKAVLSGLAQVPDANALTLVFKQFADESVKAEALQAAIAIAKTLGGAAKEDEALLPKADLAGWQGTMGYWRFEEGSVVGHSDTQIPRNEFLWAPVEVGDFYIALDVKLEPPTANAGVQFRSHKADEHGQAMGYQADMGQDVWGRLYHEHGRGKLDWTDRAEPAVKPGEWNHYEILAVGPAIWTAINGKLGVACLDLPGIEERTGGVAVQIHAGPPQTVHYRFLKLVHNPQVTLAGLQPEQLIAELKIQTPQ